MLIRTTNLRSVLGKKFYFQVLRPFAKYFMAKKAQNSLSILPNFFCKSALNYFFQVIPFTVPRKSELFQEDLYPDTQADVPAITADDWWSGTNIDPIMVPMSQEGVVIKKVRTAHKVRLGFGLVRLG